MNDFRGAGFPLDVAEVGGDAGPAGWVFSSLDGCFSDLGVLVVYHRCVWTALKRCFPARDLE